MKWPTYMWLLCPVQSQHRHAVCKSISSSQLYTVLSRPMSIMWASSSSSSSCDLSNGRCRFHEQPPYIYIYLSILCSMIGSCQTKVEWSDIRFNCTEPSLTRSAWSTVQSLGKGATLDLSARLWSTDGSARACVSWWLINLTTRLPVCTVN